MRAAIDEFIENGYHGARTRGIAKRAGVNNALIHYYYGSKKEIYVKVLNEVGDFIVGALSVIKNDDAPVEVKMGEIMDVYADFFTEHGHYAKLMLYEVIRGGSEIKKVVFARISKIPFNPVTGELYKYFQKKMKQGEIRKVNVFHLLVSIVSQIVPVYFAKEIFGDLAGGFGMKRPVFEKMVKNRKEFVIRLIMDGIKT